jgi:hypothetical protein
MLKIFNKQGALVGIGGGQKTKDSNHCLPLFFIERGLTSPHT